MDQLVRRGFTVVLLIILAGALTGCPKRPATVAARAPTAPAPAPAIPAPVPSPGAGMMPGAPGAVTAPARPTAPGPAAPVRPPAPRDFTAIPELKDIHFDFERYDIRPGDAKILDGNARWMKANPSYLVVIEGHADERGTNEYNLALGERRAKATMNYLIAQGVQANRITTISYGEERPLCPDQTEECWARNRRAHSLVKAQ